MMKISVASQTPETVVLKLEGEVARGEVAFLEQEGQRWQDQGRCLVLDLDQVRFLDQRGLDLLERWARAGVGLHGGSLFVQTLLHSRGLG